MILVGWTAVVGGDRARRIQTGRAADYVWWIGVGVLLLAASAVFGGGLG